MYNVEKIILIVIVIYQIATIYLLGSSNPILEALGKILCMLSIIASVILLILFN